MTSPQTAPSTIRSDYASAVGEFQAVQWMAKCCASDAAVAHTANAVQIHGGSGCLRGFEADRL